MDFANKGLSIREAKEIDLVDYLSDLGYEPIKVRNHDFWYRSPLRDEKEASFKINRNLNRWYDYGMGKGGNLIDFAILYHNCTVGELLQRISHHLAFHPQIRHHVPPAVREKTERIQMLREGPIISLPLIRYLKTRRIPLVIANRYCRELHYEVNEREYSGIGFKNDSDGYEIRNPFFKGGNTPKDITTIKNGSQDVGVFEGFMDFLSFITVQTGTVDASYDFVILNSVSFFTKARAFMEQHARIHLFLDRDATGTACRDQALALSSRYRDESHLYQGFKDLNEWLVNFGVPGGRDTDRHPGS